MVRFRDYKKVSVFTKVTKVPTKKISDSKILSDFIDPNVIHELVLSGILWLHLAPTTVYEAACTKAEK